MKIKKISHSREVCFGINPMHTIKQQNNILGYQNNMSANIDKMLNLAFPTLQEKILKPITILDIGSCDGELLRKIRKCFPNVSAIGLELNPKMIENAKKIDSEADLTKNISYISENANYIDKLDVKSDIVLMSKILHEIYSYDNPVINNRKFSLKSVMLFLKNIFEKLNPNGEIIIRDPAKPHNPQEIFKIDKINMTNGVNTGSDVTKYSTRAVLDRFMSDFLPAKNNYEFKDKACFAPKWLISEFIRHRQFRRSNEVWRDELNEKYGTILPSELKKLAEKIGFIVKRSENTGSLLNDSKYRIHNDEFIIENLSETKKITEKDFPANIIAVLSKQI